MSLSRRKTLVLLSGGAIVAATATFGFNITRLPQTAGLPWTQAVNMLTHACVHFRGRSLRPTPTIDSHRWLVYPSPILRSYM